MVEEPAGGLRLRRAQDRFLTTGPGTTTRHGFSFGRHYDPAWTAHGALVTHDEHRLEPGAGFGPHPHAELEVVSWVLDGALVHEDAAGRAVVPAGGLQHTTAGTGVVHAERAAGVPTRFVQLWLAAAEPGLAPAYAQPSGPEVRAGRAVVRALVLGAGQAVEVPAAAHAHVFVADGDATLLDQVLGAGDAALLTASPAVLVRAPAGCRLLVVHEAAENG